MGRWWFGIELVIAHNGVVHKDVKKGKKGEIALWRRLMVSIYRGRGAMLICLPVFTKERTCEMPCSIGRHLMFRPLYLGGLTATVRGNVCWRKVHVRKQDIALDWISKEARGDGMQVVPRECVWCLRANKADFVSHEGFKSIEVGREGKSSNFVCIDA